MSKEQVECLKCGGSGKTLPDFKDLNEALAYFMKSEHEWKPNWHVNIDGDIIHVHWSDCPYRAGPPTDGWHGIDVLRSIETDEIVGVTLWGLSNKLSKAYFDNIEESVAQALVRKKEAVPEKLTLSQDLQQRMAEMDDLIRGGTFELDDPVWSTFEKLGQVLAVAKPKPKEE